MRTTRDENHVNIERLKAMIEGKPIPIADRKALIDHLLTGCQSCMELTRATGAEFFKGVRASQYEDVMRRLGLSLVIASNDVDVQRQMGRAQWEEYLEKLDSDVRLVLLRNTPEFHHWGLFDAVRSIVRVAWRFDPESAVALAYFALEVLETLPVKNYGQDNINDFKADGYTLLAGSKRRTGDFAGSMEALRVGREFLSVGTADAYSKVEMIKAEGLLLRDIGEFERALECLEGAARIYRRYKDMHSLGKILIQQAATIGHIDPLQGVVLALNGLRILDGRLQDRFAELSGFNNLAWFQNDAGEVERARETLRKSLYLYSLFRDPATELRFHWLDGRIAKNEARYDYAERSLITARTIASSHSMEFEEVMISMDLAELMISRGRVEEALQPMQEAIELLGTCGCRRDAIALTMAVQLSIEARSFAGLWEGFGEAAKAIRRGWHGEVSIPSLSSKPN